MDSKSSNITWHGGAVRPEDRQRLLGQCGCVVWLTGLSGSGKSTLARALEAQLVAGGHAAYVLDGDNLRHGLNADLGFSARAREENIRRLGEVAWLLADAGLIVVTAFISPYRADRDRARQRVGVGRFLEVFVDAPLATCEERDPKSLYKRARAGEIAEFTGISAPYEPPLDPALVLATDRLDVAGCVERLMGELERRGFLTGDGPASGAGGGVRE